MTPFYEYLQKQHSYSLLKNVIDKERDVFRNASFNNPNPNPIPLPHYETMISDFLDLFIKNDVSAYDLTNHIGTSAIAELISSSWCAFLSDRIKFQTTFKETFKKQPELFFKCMSHYLTDYDTDQTSNLYQGMEQIDAEFHSLVNIGLELNLFSLIGQYQTKYPLVTKNQKYAQHLEDKQIIQNVFSEAELVKHALTLTNKNLHKNISAYCHQYITDIANKFQDFDNFTSFLKELGKQNKKVAEFTPISAAIILFDLHSPSKNDTLTKLINRWTTNLEFRQHLFKEKHQLSVFCAQSPEFIPLILKNTTQEELAPLFREPVYQWGGHQINFDKVLSYAPYPYFLISESYQTRYTPNENIESIISNTTDISAKLNNLTFATKDKDIEHRLGAENLTKYFDSIIFNFGIHKLLEVLKQNNQTTNPITPELNDKISEYIKTNFHKTIQILNPELESEPMKNKHIHKLLDNLTTLRTEPAYSKTVAECKDTLDALFPKFLTQQIKSFNLLDTATLFMQSGNFEQFLLLEDFFNHNNLYYHGRKDRRNPAPVCFTLFNETSVSHMVNTKTIERLADIKYEKQNVLNFYIKNDKPTGIALKKVLTHLMSVSPELTKKLITTKTKNYIEKSSNDPELTKIITMLDSYANITKKILKLEQTENEQGTTKPTPKRMKI